MKTICPCCNKEYLPKFPDNVKGIINYDEKIKSLLVYLNTYCNVPNQKIAEFLGFLSNEELKLAPATVLNTVSSFSKKSEPILKKMKAQILKAPVINEDETPITVNGKFMSTIGVFTGKISLLEALRTENLKALKRWAY